MSEMIYPLCFFGMNKLQKNYCIFADFMLLYKRTRYVQTKNMKEVKKMFDFEEYATAGMTFLGYDITDESDLANAYKNREPWVCESYGEYFVDYEKAYYILKEKGIY